MFDVSDAAARAAGLTGDNCHLLLELNLTFGLSRVMCFIARFRRRAEMVGNRCLIMTWVIVPIRGVEWSV